ncbi:Co Zn Cd efflux system membrane fusion [Chlorella sorokiniana]|uniref:Co Zn Cd efflux system membrane fusion n=1 Tax=Chlorella sorokiniana TaxID=3076 RepID=A0A2P6TC64_CHLSO|nr:Co Zn Cd efflux system membrane fusion [Chlorella sorokiniana]|eukprot:PRW20230.1 Co Zn Cd efflux system membrane fusion [Chlorella sorokiniana]
MAAAAGTPATVEEALAELQRVSQAKQDLDQKTREVEQLLGRLHWNHQQLDIVREQVHFATVSAGSDGALAARLAAGPERDAVKSALYTWRDDMHRLLNEESSDEDVRYANTVSRTIKMVLDMHQDLFEQGFMREVEALHQKHGDELRQLLGQDLEYLESCLDDAHAREIDLQRQLAAKDEEMHRVAASYGCGAALMPHVHKLPSLEELQEGVKLAFEERRSWLEVPTGQAGPTLDHQKLTNLSITLLKCAIAQRGCLDEQEPLLNQIAARMSQLEEAMNQVKLFVGMPAAEGQVQLGQAASMTELAPATAEAAEEHGSM